MADDTLPVRVRCRNCGFEAPAESDEWGRADHPTLGSLTQCPGCESTDTTTLA